MIKEILIPLVTIALAEIGDKTQLTLFCLVAKTQKHTRLFFGAMVAFFIVDGFAILAGEFLSRVIPGNIVKVVSGILFIAFGISFIIQKHENNLSYSLKQPFISAFTLILFSEMGDKTQIISGLFASNYNSLLVLIGVILGLAFISFLTIQAGRLFLTKINTNLLHKISGMIFIVLGLSTFVAIFI